MIFLDQKAAFPSIARNYMFWVLEKMMIPSHIIAAIKLLYENNTAVVKFGNSKEVTFEMQQGIRQGCPLSGTLWALVFDPVVRLLSCRIDYRHTKLSAYADDMAFVLHSIKNGLPLLADALT